MSSRLWILDPGFENVGGHHYELNRAIVADCARRGTGVRIAAHREIHGEAADLPVDRIFSHSIYAESYSGGRREPIRRRCLEDLASLPGWRFAPDDVLLLHSVAPAHFMAVCEWFAGLPADGRPRSVVLHTVGWFGDEWTQGVFEWSAEFRRAAELLARAAGPGVTFAAANEPLCEDWAVHAGQPARLHPIPCPVIADTRNRPAPPSAAPRFAFLGGARREKGFELLPDLIPLLARRCPESEILVQAAPVPATCPDTIDRLRELERSCPPLRIHWGEAPAAEYHRLLAASDIVLHPYDPVRYQVRGSGVFFESMASGLPVVLPGSTWMAEEWTHWDAGGALFGGWRAEAVVEAAAGVARSYAGHRARSLQAAERWNAKHSVAAFVDFVLGAPHPG